MKRIRLRSFEWIAVALTAMLLVATSVSAGQTSSLPRYGAVAQTAVPNPFMPGGTGGALPPCPHVCLLITEGKSAEDAIAQFEAQNHCTATPAAPDEGAQDQACSEKWRADDIFLKVSEGALRTDGYVPVYKKDTTDKNGKVHKKGEAYGNSGVTISTGVDLGQQDSSGTRHTLDEYIQEKGNAANVDVDALLKKLDPYFGKKRADAINALKAQPLTVTKDEARLLADAFKFKMQVLAARQFDRNNKKEMVFKKLPQEAQTIIVDFVYQYYVGDKSGIKKEFWDYVYAGDWQGLATWLKSKPDIYDSRREREGKLLQEAIDAEHLPKTGDPCAAKSDDAPADPSKPTDPGKPGKP